MNKLINK